MMKSAKKKLSRRRTSSKCGARASSQSPTTPSAASRKRSTTPSAASRKSPTTPSAPLQPSTTESSVNTTSKSVFTISNSSTSPGPDLEEKKSSGKPLSDEAKREIAAFVNETMKKGVEGFREEFEKLQESTDCKGSFRTSELNQTKNRFKTVSCLDETRVVLTLFVPPETDYVHANWVKMLSNKRKFIVTQAPLEGTVGDFWRLCFQESVSSILLMDKPEEMQCPQFWSMEPGATLVFGHVRVTTKKFIVEETHMKFFLRLWLTEDIAAPVNVTLLVMLRWPSKGVPLRGGAFLTLLQAIRAGTTCVVVCIEGIGRSCVAVAVDTITKRLMKGLPVDVKRAVVELRSMRSRAIATPAQYVFVVICVLDYIKAKAPEYRKKIEKFRGEVKKAKLA